MSATDVHLSATDVPLYTCYLSATDVPLYTCYLTMAAALGTTETLIAANLLACVDAELVYLDLALARANYNANATASARKDDVPNPNQEREEEEVKKKRRRYWVNPWLLKRPQRGQHRLLMQDLRLRRFESV